MSALKNVFSFSSFLLSFFFCITSFMPSLKSQASEQDYYFFYDRQIRDVRDHSVVLDKVRHGIARTQEDGGFILVYDDGTRFTMMRYDKQNRKLFELFGDGAISPDWDYVLSVKKGDLYYQSLDLQKGMLGVQKQLTQIGVIRAPFKYELWFGNKVVFNAGGNAIYHLNVISGEIAETGLGLIYLQNKVSPSGRYAFVNKGLYDVLENRLIIKTEYRHQNSWMPHFNEQESGFMLRWVDDHRFLVLLSQKRDSDGNADLGTVDVRQPDLMTRVQIDLAKGNSTIKGWGRVNNLRNDNFCANVRWDNSQGFGRFSKMEKNPRLPEFDQSHLMLLSEGESHVGMVDLETGGIHEFPEKGVQLRANPYFSAVLGVEWVAKDKMIYATSGDILTQGTWVYDTQTREKKKITPYPAVKFWSFAKTDFVMFVANGNLYRCKKNGTDLKMLEENIYQRKEISLFMGSSYFDSRL